MLQEKGINKKRVNWFIFQNVNINGIVDILNSKWFLFLKIYFALARLIILNKTGTPSGGGLWKTEDWDYQDWLINWPLLAYVLKIENKL